MKKIKLLFAGLSVFVVGTAVVHAKTNSQIKTDDLNPFSSIDASVETSDINIIKGDKYKIEIDVCRPEEEIKYCLDGDKLIVTGECKTKVKDTSKYNIITIYSPKISSVSLSAKSGDISTNSLQMDNLTASTTTGDVKINNITTQKTNANTLSGNVNLFDIKTNELTANATNGDINIAKTEAQKVNVNTHSGDVNLCEANIKDTNITGNSGNVKINLNNPHNLNLKAGNGTIIVDGKRYEDEYIKDNKSDNSISVKVGSGDIKITHKL